MQERPGEQLFSYRVPIDFDVSAPNEQDARRMVDDALIGGAAPATPGIAQRGQQVRADGDISGVLGWQHPSDADPRDPVGEVLRERADALNAPADVPPRERPAPDGPIPGRA